VGAASVAQVVQRVVNAKSWDHRVGEIRRVPELFGEGQRAAVYAAIAEAVYKPHLSAQFAYVQWREEYELRTFKETYDRSVELTGGFQNVDPEELAHAIEEAPVIVRVLRAIVGYTPAELAAAATEAGKDLGAPAMGQGTIKSLEAGRRARPEALRAIAEAVHRLVTGTMWEVATGDFRSKIDKPDTAGGWDSVRQMAEHGVPYAVLLHQRHYGGAFRTLLDATGTARGEALLEQPVEVLLTEKAVPFIKTGAHNQAEIAQRFGLTVRPAPDFVVFEGEATLAAMIECKQANDGGTARDKAARFRTLRGESERLGGVPVFAVLDGLGWERTGDALGPVVRDTDGRVFSLGTLPELVAVQPFPRLAGKG
jgi:hypothetical protein